MRPGLSTRDRSRCRSWSDVAGCPMRREASPGPSGARRCTPENAVVSTAPIGGLLETAAAAVLLCIALAAFAAVVPGAMAPAASTCRAEGRPAGHHSVGEEGRSSAGDAGERRPGVRAGSRRPEVRLERRASCDRTGSSGRRRPSRRSSWAPGGFRAPGARHRKFRRGSGSALATARPLRDEPPASVTEGAGAQTRRRRPSPTPAGNAGLSADEAKPVVGPRVLLAAYRQAVAGSPPACHLPVSLLAAIGQVESGSLAGRSIDAAHRAVPPVLGPVARRRPRRRDPDTDSGNRLDGGPGGTVSVRPDAVHSRHLGGVRDRRGRRRTGRPAERLRRHLPAAAWLPGALRGRDLRSTPQDWVGDPVLQPLNGIPGNGAHTAAEVCLHRRRDRRRGHQHHQPPPTSASPLLHRPAGTGVPIIPSGPAALTPAFVRAAAKLAFTMAPSPAATPAPRCTSPPSSCRTPGAQPPSQRTLTRVTLTLTSPDGALLACASNRPATSGVASFTGCTIDTAGTYTLTATDGSLAQSSPRSGSHEVQIADEEVHDLGGR